jgi:hypothetical protein
LVSTNHLAEPAALILGLVGYGWLFASTIKQNFRNRGVVLGALTVGMFAGFLFYAHLFERHSAPWLLTTVEAIIILMGLSLLAFVGLDVFRWASGKRELVGDERTAKSRLRAK